MLFVTCFFTLLLLVMVPFFLAFIQTIKNLIFFVSLVTAVSLNFLLYYGVEFFPIFFILIYIGAIIVSTLFMVLTFDLRREYVRKSISKKGLFNAASYFFRQYSLRRRSWPTACCGLVDLLIALIGLRPTTRAALRATLQPGSASTPSARALFSAFSAARLTGAPPTWL